MPAATPPDHPTRDAGFGIYLHWPFCAAKCPYCDFNSHVRHAGVDQPRFLAAFRREIAHAAALAPGRTVTSIFLGGGTPSLMAPNTVAGLLDAVAGAWSVAPDAEVTLEANPTSVEATRFRGYRAAGVNRVSLGVQALDDGDLKRLGRLHSVAEALDAVRTASAHFERFSFDLIYARPEQTPEAWAAELRRAIDYAAEHLSLYQLTIEPGTPFFGLAQAGRLVPPDDDASRALYDVTQEIWACGPAGLRDLEPRPTRCAVAPQPALLALRRVCRHRPRRPWSPRPAAGPNRHAHREGARRLARPRRARRPRHRRDGNAVRRGSG
jgi:putative oxygen-independent coproporphyrinogen III oxidase